MSGWHDYPIIKDQVCLKCSSGPVHLILTTGYVMYLRCEACRHQWTTADRRARSAATDIPSRDERGA